MATGIVRAAILSTIDKTPSLSPRSSKMKEKAQEIVAKASVGEIEMEAMDKFCLDILTYFRDKVSVANRCKGYNRKREHLWSTFHKLRMDKHLLSLWNDLLSKLCISVDDPLLEQSVYQEIFEIVIKEYFEGATSSSCRSLPKCTIDNISTDELNVIRYACGYVAHKLLKRYEKKSGDVVQQYIICLGEMAVEGEGNDFLAYTRRWLELVNRGGLFPLNDEAFQFFVEIELCVRTYLPQHILKKHSDEDTFTQNVHDKIFNDEDVQFYWTLISQDIEESRSSEKLLKEIIKLWVTVRGFSIAGYWMEAYKTKEKSSQGNHLLKS